MLPFMNIIALTDVKSIFGTIPFTPKIALKGSSNVCNYCDIYNMKFDIRFGIRSSLCQMEHNVACSFTK